MKIFRIILFVFALAFASFTISGCANSLVTAPAPQSVSEQVAYGYGAITAIRTTAAQAVASGSMSVATGKKVLADTDTARAALDAAVAATSTGDTTTAASKLAIATSLLTTLQTYLTAQGVK